MGFLLMTRVLPRSMSAKRLWNTHKRHTQRGIGARWRLKIHSTRCSTPGRLPNSRLDPGGVGYKGRKWCSWRGKLVEVWRNGADWDGTLFAGRNRGRGYFSALYGLPIITSVALMRAMAGSPALRFSSCTASAVMMAVIRWLPTDKTTLASRPSTVTATMVPRS